MRMIVQVTLYSVLLILSQLQAVEYYYFAGDAPQDGEIYRNKENNLFINAKSLPYAYRSRITKNSEAFEKVDMAEVVEDKKVSDTGVASYSHRLFARASEELVHDTDTGRFIVLSTVPASERETLLNDKRFKKVALLEQEDVGDEAVEDKIMSSLDSLLGIDTKYSVLAKHEDVSKAYSTYLEEKLSEQQGVVDYIDGEISKYTKKGDLKSIEKWQGWKIKFMADDLVAETISDKKLQKIFEKTSGKVQESFSDLLDEVNDKIIRLVKDNKVAEAKVLQEWVLNNGTVAEQGLSEAVIPRRDTVTKKQADDIIKGHVDMDDKTWSKYGGIEIKVDSAVSGKTPFKVKKGDVYLMVPNPEDRWCNGLSWKGDGAVHNYLGTDADRRALIWRVGSVSSGSMLITLPSNEDYISFMVNLGAAPSASAGYIRIKLFKVVE